MTMSKRKESPLRAEMGDKKFDAMVEKKNREYDRYKAGKRDPKTGEYYHHISTEDPRKPKISLNTRCVCEDLGHVKCSGCKEKISVTSSSRVKVCLFCGSDNFFSNELKENLRNKLRKKNEQEE